MTTTSIELTDRLESVIHAVPGVRVIYPAAPLLTTVVSEVVAATTSSRPASSHIIVEHTSAGGVAATIHIGVNGVSPASEVARAAGEAARDFLRSTGAEECIVNVRIGSIG